jgi:rod shape-determining protein MreB
VGERTSEEIKIEIGSAYPMEENKQLEVKGRDLVSGIPKTIVINEEEIRDALDEPISQIVEGVKAALENTPPELSADIVDKGIVLAGGGALLRGLDILLREETNLPITIADDPLSTIVLGAGQALNEIELLKQISIR